MVIGYAAYNVTFNIYGKNSIVENLSDFNVYFHSIKVNGNEVEGINSNKDSFAIEGNINGTVDYEIINDSTDYDANTFVNYTIDDNTIGNTLEFDYTGGEQVFTALEDVVYKLETWGAQHATDSTTYHEALDEVLKGRQQLIIILTEMLQIIIQQEEVKQRMDMVEEI